MGTKPRSRLRELLLEEFEYELLCSHEHETGRYHGLSRTHFQKVRGFVHVHQMIATESDGMFLHSLTPKTSSSELRTQVDRVLQ